MAERDILYQGFARIRQAALANDSAVGKSAAMSPAAASGAALALDCIASEGTPRARG